MERVSAYGFGVWDVSLMNRVRRVRVLWVLGLWVWLVEGGGGEEERLDLEGMLFGVSSRFLRSWDSIVMGVDCW